MTRLSQHTLTADCRDTRVLCRILDGRCRGSKAPSIAAGELSKDSRNRRSTSSVPPTHAALLTELSTEIEVGQGDVDAGLVEHAGQQLHTGRQVLRLKDAQYGRRQALKGLQNLPQHILHTTCPCCLLT